VCHETVEAVRGLGRADCVERVLPRAISRATADVLADLDAEKVSNPLRERVSHFFGRIALTDRLLAVSTFAAHDRGFPFL